MTSLVFFSENKLSRMRINFRETVQFFELKAYLTFDNLVFADITPFAVVLGVRGIEK